MQADSEATWAMRSADCLMQRDSSSFAGLSHWSRSGYGSMNEHDFLPRAGQKIFSYVCSSGFAALASVGCPFQRLLHLILLFEGRANAFVCSSGLTSHRDPRFPERI